MLTQIYVAMESLGHNELKGIEIILDCKLGPIQLLMYNFLHAIFV